MSIILGALGGAGEALQSVGSTLMKNELDTERDRNRMNLESDLALQRAKTLEEFKVSLQNAPLARLGTKAQDFAQQDVPLEAPKVTSLSGQGSAGPVNFVGDPGIVQRAIANLPEPDRTAAMQQFQQQMSTDQQTSADSVAGKTRKRTSDEALSAAVDDAKVNDLPAYAQYEKEIGKPKRDEKRVDVLQQREDNRADLNANIEQRRADAEQRRFIVDAAKLDLQQGNQDVQNRKIDALIEHWERGDDRKDQPKAPTAERMTSVVNAMNNSIRDLDANKPSKNASDEDKQAWQLQRGNAIAVRARAMSKLNSNFDDTGADAAAGTPPGAAPAAGGPTGLPLGTRQIGTSGGKPVYETPDGKRFIEK